MSKDAAMSKELEQWQEQIEERLTALEQMQRGQIVARSRELVRAARPPKPISTRTFEELQAEMEEYVKMQAEMLEPDGWPKLSQVVGAFNKKASHLLGGSRALLKSLVESNILSIESLPKEAQRVRYEPFMEWRRFLSAMREHQDIWAQYNEALSGGQDEPEARRFALDQVAKRKHIEFRKRLQAQSPTNKKESYAEMLDRMSAKTQQSVKSKSTE